MAAAASRSWDEQRRRAFFWGSLPALVVLVVITLAPAIYLVVTSLTPLNLINPMQTGYDFSDPALNYREASLDYRVSSTRSGSRSSCRSRPWSSPSC